MAASAQETMTGRFSIFVTSRLNQLKDELIAEHERCFSCVSSETPQTLPKKVLPEADLEFEKREPQATASSQPDVVGMQPSRISSSPEVVSSLVSSLGGDTSGDASKDASALDTPGLLRNVIPSEVIQPDMFSLLRDKSDASSVTASLPSAAVGRIPVPQVKSAPAHLSSLVHDVPSCLPGVTECVSDGSRRPSLVTPATLHESVSFVAPLSGATSLSGVIPAPPELQRELTNGTVTCISLATPRHGPTHCRSCFHEMPNDASFCRECGVRRDVPMSPTLMSQCACGNRLMEDAVFCRRCGVPVGSSDEERQCFKCGNVMMRDAQYCRKCGHKRGMNAQSSNRSSQGMFFLHPVWSRGREQDLTSHVAFLQSVAISSNLQKNPVSSVATGSSWPELMLSKLMMRPNAAHRVLWDFIQFIVLVYEAILLPMEFLDLTETRLIVFMRWFIRLYWTVDLPLSFTTGYWTREGRLEMRPPEVARNFLRTWLLFDFSMIALDWVSLVASGSEAESRLTVAVGVLRMARLLRIIRLVRLVPDLLRSVGYLIRDPSIPLVIGVFQILCVTVYINHCVACTWYGLGNVGTDRDVTWLRSAGIRGISNKAYGYAVAWHWSLTQFVGTMEVNPKTATERVYAICILFFAFMTMCVLPARITSLMTELQLVSAHKSTQMSLLTEFLYDHKVSRRLALEVQRNARRALTRQQCRHETDIAVMSLLSEPLLVEMHYEMFSGHLMKHPLFRLLDTHYHMAFQQLCHKAVSQTYLAQDDAVFYTGEFPDKPVMYFVLSGELEYRRYGKDGFNVVAGQWVSEGTLWTPWVHHGSMWARTTCSLLMLRAIDFQDIMTKYMSPDAELQQYGEFFVAELNGVPPDTITDLGFLDSVRMANQAFRYDCTQTLTTQSLRQREKFDAVVPVLGSAG